MTELSPIHLVERAAARLRGEAGLSSLASPLPPPGLAEDAAAPLAEAEAPPGPAALFVARATAAPALADAGPAPQLAPQPASPPEGLAPAAPQPIAIDMPTLHKAGLVAGTGRRSRIAEELSVTAGSVLRSARAGGPGGAMLAPPGNLVMVTSARPNEGKSFVALNIAATLAQHGTARVLLVDIDPKPGSMSALLGHRHTPGLLDLAANPALKPEAVVLRTAIRDLSVLPLGTRAAAEGHGVTRPVAAALERLARRYAGHLLLIDSPPCLATSEASALAPMVGLTAMVVEAERTQRDELEHAIELMKPCPNLLLVLNKVQGNAGNDFGGYDYYGV